VITKLRKGSLARPGYGTEAGLTAFGVRCRARIDRTLSGTGDIVRLRRRRRSELARTCGLPAPFWCEGDVDLATVGQLDHDIQTVVEVQQTASIVVDLADVRFLDSNDIASLLKGRRLDDAAAKPYRVTDATGMVRQVLDITGVWAHLSVPRD
jgi:anti-sigma B factor antagonist